VSGRCPVCIRPTDGGLCPDHGPWQPHQLLDEHDSSRVGRRRWHPFTPLPQACPRCLGDVAPSGQRFHCLERLHGARMHGPFRVDELLGPTAQRDSALHRSRLSRQMCAQRPAVSFESPLPDAGRVLSLVTGAVVVGATLSFLLR
jgi:hypothetical protein